MDPLHRGLLELAGGVHDDLRGAGRDRRPLVRLPVEAVAGEHPLGPECEGVWDAHLFFVVDGQLFVHRRLDTVVQTTFESPVSPSYAAMMPFSAQSLQVTWYAEDRVCKAPGRLHLHSGHCGTRHTL